MNFNWASPEDTVFWDPSLLRSNCGDEQEKLLNIMAEVKENSAQALALFASSGTSAKDKSQRKWVALTIDAILASARAVNEHLGATHKDTWMQALPRYHIGGASVEARAFLSGSKVIDWRSANAKWRVDSFYEVLKSEACTLVSLVPAQVFDLVMAKYQAPPNLRAVIVGGGALSNELYFQGRALGWPLLPSFGMTEAASQIATAELKSLNEDHDCFPKLKILSHVNAKIEGGVLQIQGSSLFAGHIYFGGSAPTDWTWVPRAEGWYTTDDLARIDLVGSGEFELSFLTPLGRRGEVYKVGGELVSLYLLSGILNSIVDTYRLKAQHENFQAYLFAADDQRLGKVIHLYVESLDFLELPKTETERLLKIGAEIKSAFDSRVRPFEKIREVKAVGTVEKSAIGKINKNQLSELQTSMR